MGAVVNDRAIVVASDGSTIADDTVRRAGALATSLRMSLHVVVPRGTGVRVADRLAGTVPQLNLHEADGDTACAGWTLAEGAGGSLLVLGPRGDTGPWHKLLARFGLRVGGESDRALQVIDVERFRRGTERDGGHVSLAPVDGLRDAQLHG